MQSFLNGVVDKSKLIYDKIPELLILNQAEPKSSSTKKDIIDSITSQIGIKEFHGNKTIGGINKTLIKEYNKVNPQKQITIDTFKQLESKSV